ncbi:ionotropic receptor 93a-like [Scylla paramamosain]|uniref:ionotropic receptor 93a-like n=1 Tax=Scylla paramamosain TaxID=85552 RepID=UPI003082BFB0
MILLVKKLLLMWVVVGAVVPNNSVVKPIVSRIGSGHGSDSERAVPNIIENASEWSCVLLFLGDRLGSQDFPFKEIWNIGQRRLGVAVFEVGTEEINMNMTHRLSRLLPLARRVRRLASCTMVVAVSHDPVFLAALAEWSLSSRLLVWTTKMVVVTRLTFLQLRSLLPTHWTFSMMNVVFLTLKDQGPNISVYCYLPYGEHGERIVEVASPTKAIGSHPVDIFSAKRFSKFYGAVLNVTPLPFMPFWGEVEVQTPDGTSVTKYEGSDYQMLLAVASALNFTFRVLPSNSWAEATIQVQERVSFLCPVYHIMMSVRAEKYDFTYTYEYAYFSFAMAKPEQEPRWRSLYYPLAYEVWLAVMGSLLFVPVTYMMIIRIQQLTRRGIGAVFQDMTGILLGQNLPHQLPNSSASRVMVAAWLAFALIFATAYRGNLTAYLTLPKYPSRPETLPQLVDVVKRVTIPQYGSSFLDFYSQSDSPVFKKLASLLTVGTSVMQGLQEAIDNKQAHLGGRRYLQQVIAESFTMGDGSTRLYLGKESVFPGPSGWPVPHDAPYKAALDRWIMAAIEAGLYEKWVADTIMETKARSQRRQRESRNQEEKIEVIEESSGASPEALSLLHLQGAFVILGLGTLLAAVINGLESLLVRLKNHL